ncbi:hypothetical protein [Sphingomonas oryzagri]
MVRDSPIETVERAMRTGDRWFDAWQMQEATPTPRLAKRTRLSEMRLRAIADGATFTRWELELLAQAWWITPDALLASMPDPERVVG